MTQMNRRLLIKGAAALGAFSAMPSLVAVAQNNPVKIGIVGKVRIPWFDNVEKGVLKAGQDLGVDATMIIPTQADAAQQVRAVEDLIAKKVDVIGVIPNDGVALEPVFKRAKDAGIHVIVHELPAQKNADWDIELIQDKQFGEAHLEAFAQAIGGEGKYVVYVGGLTVTLHNLWADYAVALQKEKYPKMQQIGDRYGVSNSVEDSQKTAIDVMRANPDLKGFLIFGANGPIGAGQAVADREKIGKVIVVGPFIPSQGQKLMKMGAITRGFLWNPIDAGYAMVALGSILAKGETPSDGMEIPGLGAVQLGPEERTLRANKMLDINPDTIDELAKLI
jgi:simple sugar transport system substrate-binding protein